VEQDIQLTPSNKRRLCASRINTGRSLASDILEQKCRGAAGEKEKVDLSLVTPFIRAGKLIRAQWKNYFLALSSLPVCALYLLFYLSNMGPK
jgi:hypothetical protein